MDEIIKNIKLFLGEDLVISDELIKLYINMVTQRILNYINLKSLPEELKYDVLIPMVISIIEDNKKTSTKDLKIGSINEGGKTVVFRQDDFVSAQIVKINERMDFYKNQLNTFRRLV